MNSKKFNLTASVWFDSYEEAIKHANIVADYIESQECFGQTDVIEYTIQNFPPSMLQGRERI